MCFTHPKSYKTTTIVTTPCVDVRAMVKPCEAPNSSYSEGVIGQQEPNTIVNLIETLSHAT